MQFTVKDVTGSVYSSPDMTKQDMLNEVLALGGTEDDARKTYQALVVAMEDWTNLTKIAVNVGSIALPQTLNFNPANLVYISVSNRIEEWEADE